PDTAMEIREERVARVTRKQLVRALAHLNDLRSTASGFFRDRVERHADRVCQRLILMPDQLRQVFEKVLLADDDLVVARTKTLGDRSGETQFVGRGVTFNGNRERAHGAISELR